MKVIKEKNYFDMDIILEEDDKYIRFSYGGNMDLYWSIHTKDSNVSKKFIITKENYFIYSLFERLINDIKEANIYEPKYPQNEDDIFGNTTEEDCKRWNERLKTRYHYSRYYWQSF